MLRVEMQNSDKVLIVRLEGRLTGDDAEHARTLMTRSNTEKALLVDLTEVTYIDPAGEATLTFLSRLGAKFIAEDVYVVDVCKRLNLLQARNGKGKV